MRVGTSISFQSKSLDHTADLEDLQRELEKAGAPPVLLLKECATLARCSYSTIWNAVQSQTLVAHKQGKWRVLRTELAKWILRQR